MSVQGLGFLDEVSDCLNTSDAGNKDCIPTRGGGVDHYRERVGPRHGSASVSYRRADDLTLLELEAAVTPVLP